MCALRQKLKNSIFLRAQKCKEITHQLLASRFVTSDIVTSVWRHIVEDTVSTYGTDLQ